MFDTSAFAKRYIDEYGTDAVIDVCQKTSELLLCSLCVPEFISVLARLKRENKITSLQYKKIKTAFLLDIKDAVICQISQEIIIKSVPLLEKYTLRTLDSLHISSAQIMLPDLFVSADKRQLEAAKGEGLKVLSVSS
ncbi:MAG: type II toxin-antitoxin system VapC family toxin [Pseudomonadota bacterium]|nr:type II toxin-antitoxin system VapC family toxin [Pseudomonadota bacterium]